jgi:hypothetical protein
MYVCIYIPTEKKSFTYEAVTVTRKVERKQKKEKEKNTFGTNLRSLLVMLVCEALSCKCVGP